MNPKILGAIKVLGGIALWAAVNAVLVYLSDATHLNGYVNTTLALLIAAVAGAIENNIQSKTGNALFGAVSTR